MIIFLVQVVLYVTYSGVPCRVEPAQHPHQMVTQKVAVWHVPLLRVDICRHHHGEPLPDSRTFKFRGNDAKDPRQIDAAVADGWCWGAEAEGEAIAGDAHSATLSTQSAPEYREYELIWLLQQRLRAVSWPHCCGACAACSHCSATACDLSGLDHSHAAIPQRVTRASCAQLLRFVLGAACR